MSVKTEVLSLLEANRDQDLSGQKIADCLGVSRSAVWKAVQSLKDEGYQVQGVNNRGYRLDGGSDVLSAEGIRPGLQVRYQDTELCICKKIDSTNQEVKRQALRGAKEGLVVLAEEQTAGKGRKGRGFISPPGTGIYMSVLFCPTEEQAKNIVLVTTAAAVAVCRAIRQVLHEEAEIKWVNDVYLHGKKVCGILTEAVSDIESGRVGTVIVGIGINYREPEGGFPEEIRQMVGSVCPVESYTPRNCLVSSLLNELFSLYRQLPERTWMDDYKRWSNVIGKKVRFSSAIPGESNWESARAVGIDEDGGLVVRMDDGEERILRTGEISLRISDKDSDELGISKKKGGQNGTAL